MLNVSVFLLFLLFETSSAFVPLSFLSTQTTTTTTALSASSWYNDPAVVWSLRLSSGLLTYAGLVACFDRPQGTLRVPDSVQVRPSAVAGLGLFVTQDMPAGTILGTYPGTVVSLNDYRLQQKASNFPQCETYIWRFSDNGAVIDPTDATGELRDVCTSSSAPFLFRVPTTLCRINEPPKGQDVNVVTDELERKVILKLERNVMAGEELFMDYGPQYDRSSYR